MVTLVAGGLWYEKARDLHLGRRRGVYLVIGNGVVEASAAQFGKSSSGPGLNHGPRKNVSADFRAFFD